MTKLWEVFGTANTVLVTGDRADNHPGAFLVADLPWTERPMSIRALRTISKARHDKAFRKIGPQAGLGPCGIHLTPSEVLEVLRGMAPNERFVGGAVACPPPTDEEVASVVDGMFGKWASEGGEPTYEVATIIGLFCALRNAA